jgi:hypothetical protein
LDEVAEAAQLRQFFGGRRFHDLQAY